MASIVETPERYYANLEKLLMTFDSNTQTNEVIVCVKGIYTDDELASISYIDDSKIQYWLDYTTVNLNLKQVVLRKPTLYLALLLLSAMQVNIIKWL